MTCCNAPTLGRSQYADQQSKDSERQQGEGPPPTGHRQHAAGNQRTDS